MLSVVCGLWSVCCVVCRVSGTCERNYPVEEASPAEGMLNGAACAHEEKSERERGKGKRVSNLSTLLFYDVTHCTHGLAQLQEG